MSAIIKNELKRTRTGLAIWSSVAALIAWFGMIEYPVIGQNIELFEDALNLIPKIGRLICGVYNANLYDPLGYYSVMYYWTGLIVFAHAVYTGASIISKESRDKTVEYLFTKPYKRWEIVSSKIIAGFVDISAISVVATAATMLAMIPAINEPAVYWQVLVSGIGMLLTQCVLMSLGLLCSAIFKTYKSGTWGAAIMLMASYCLMFFVQYIDKPSLNFLSPLTYFSISDVVENGLDILYILISVLVMAVCLYFTQRLYAKKAMIA
jgi:ABC-2 type transport system permease protein